VSNLHVRPGVLIGIVCLFFLVLVLPLATPAPVNAYHEPKIATTIPKDPGTPFEEPEIGDTGTNPAGGPTKPNGPLGGDVLLSTQTDGGQGTMKIVMRKILLRHLLFVLWHSQGI
jgi:hypothetical protein